MRFKTRNGNTIQVSGGSGHDAVVGPEWRDLEERFHLSAYASGCISEDQIRNTANEHIDPAAQEMITKIALRNEAILGVMRDIIDNNNLKALNSNGMPITTFLSEKVGFRVNNSERDALWYKLQEGKK
jgi:hypothetical protein